jgi:hypothetical protein
VSVDGCLHLTQDGNDAREKTVIEKDQPFDVASSVEQELLIGVGSYSLFLR